MAPKKSDADDVVDDIFTYEDSDDIVIDMSEVEEAKGFEVIPSGWYLADITDDSEREVGKEGGKIPYGTKGVQFTFTIAEGPYEGRKIWDGFWFHPSSYPYLKKLMAKSGRFDDVNARRSAGDIIDSLNGARLWIKVGIRKGKGEYEDSNNIREYKSEDERVGSTSASDMFG